MAVIATKDVVSILRARGHLSMLKALVEAAEDIEAGRVYAWDEFKPRLARLRAKAKRVARA
ncbi:MAG: hypothetical protein HY017_31550 [Betaproteobacteria bacterium]|nr:hypothetical protein [Betaproteobacteria bacterium]